MIRQPCPEINTCSHFLTACRTKHFDYCVHKIDMSIGKHKNELLADAIQKEATYIRKLKSDMVMNAEKLEEVREVLYSLKVGGITSLEALQLIREEVK